MNRTDDRGYPYPEADCSEGCDGPALVRDAADLPAQLQALALAVDEDLTEIDLAIDLDLNGPAAEMTGPAQLLSPGQAFTLDTVVMDQGNMQADIAGSRLVIPSTGLYVITGGASIAAITSPDAITLNILANGVSVARTTWKPTNSAGSAARANIQVMRRQNEGDVLMLAQDTNNADTWSNPRFAAVRLRRL